MELSAIVDDTPCFTWDMRGILNCSRSPDGATITYMSELHDYMNVLTEVPIREGVHFVEFHMHSVQDELGLCYSCSSAFFDEGSQASRVCHGLEAQLRNSGVE